MDAVTMARALFGTSMAFHIIFATLGVGLPLMIVCAEIMYWRRKDRDYAILARRWTKALGILLGVAIPSGTIVGVMLALLWPGFMEIVGQVIALPFQIEMWAFFFEALFMAIYIYAADRLSNGLRLLSVFFVMVGASASAVLITDAQAWMNTPTGFKIINGQITDVDPWAAFFNPSFFTSALHVLTTSYMTGAFFIVTSAAYYLLKRNQEARVIAYHRKGLMLGIVVGLIMSLLTAINGHETAQALHRNNPEKLAAAEALFETTRHAPLLIGGIVDADTQTVKYGIEIPGFLSFLAGNSFDTEVKGLNEVPREDWPPLFVHTLFNLMVGIGFGLLALALFTVFWRFIYRKSERQFPRWVVYVFSLTGPLSLLGIEIGWIFSCSARQPWTIYHVQRTSEAALKSDSMGTLFLLFVSVYVLLLILTSLVMRFYFKRHPVSSELREHKEASL
ncbi:cytochrome ubiquinol oxidase subunit I [Paenibacillus sp. ACRRX]|uniref:cytochrome ubiquinol oxidase subunit I n=1 Tax=unclassified Paenibacillus TaxID=185978 RepID=UPI001EF60CE5|nr:cytochrome ubiquinol oxidase subunit I [Paenibacillus sp. UMB4589-SE434]MCG7409060.1 cytochrome ubiquinol oxidase subunit I [Paenibacillus sp. ACRRX]MDK8181940.1 cytochrome ubiquinol oxidase subunit I [Paenibacillus sp. UMB4589-SE434]